MLTDMDRLQMVLHALMFLGIGVIGLALFWGLIIYFVVLPVVRFFIHRIIRYFTKEIKEAAYEEDQSIIRRKTRE